MERAKDVEERALETEQVTAGSEALSDVRTAASPEWRELFEEVRRVMQELRE